jgi:hypothetical protein
VEDSFVLIHTMFGMKMMFAAFHDKLSRTSPGPWTELPAGYQPEGNVAIFCSICQGKNRSDEGWRYRNSLQYAFKVIKDVVGLPEDLVRMMAGEPFALLEYQCAYCRREVSARRIDETVGLPLGGDGVVKHWLPAVVKSKELHGPPFVPTMYS